jgi:hypothetical protein
MGNTLKLLAFFLMTAVMGTIPAAADDCAARCRAQEMQCLQQSKGDTAKCNAITTQCYQSCRKPK